MSPQPRTRPVSSRLVLAQVCILCVIALPTASGASGAADPSEGSESGDTPIVSRYACWQLGDALSDLADRGLPLVWSDDLVRPELQVLPPDESAEVSDAARDAVDELLRPFDLRLEDASGLWMVVATAPAPPRPIDPARPVSALPRFIDRNELPTVWTFPTADHESEPTPAGPHLVVRWTPGAAMPATETDWRALAYRLKDRIVAAASERPGLRVALDAPPEIATRLAEAGAAPYLDAYVHRGTPFVPTRDGTARTWWWVEDERLRALPALLRAAQRGEGLVIFADRRIDADHRAFLAAVDVTGAAELDDVPAVDGIPQERVRFLVETGAASPRGSQETRPVLGDLLLAFDSQGPEELSFEIPGLDRVEALFPQDAPLSTRQNLGRTTLWVDGSAPQYLLRLRMHADDQGFRTVEVEDTGLVDPWEIVVRNQVFQRRQRERFESLDVMESIQRRPQWMGADQIDWTHRILQRKGKLTEFHHLGYAINGAPVPKDRLLMGRLFRTEALIQLYPLELELDETYAYRYLGTETVRGRVAHVIDFEPLRDGSAEDGALVRGTVWIDTRTDAHLRIRTVQNGLDGQLVRRELTTEYEWIADDRQCFWDWRTRRGSSVLTQNGTVYSYDDRTVREGFDFNRPDIDEVVRAGHESDVMIHVETPPHGHRWLVRSTEGRRAVEDAEPYPSGGLSAPAPSASETESPDGRSDATQNPQVDGPGTESVYPDEEEAAWSSRVLADIHAFSRHARLDFGGFGSRRGEDVELFPGVVLTDDDFLHRGYQVYLGLFVDRGLASLSLPAPWSERTIFSLVLDAPFESEINPDFGFRADGSFVGLDLRTKQSELRLDLATPLARGLSSRFGYAWRPLRIQSNGVAGFVQPIDTDEHILFGDLQLRRGGSVGSMLASVGVETGHRADWRPWGLDAAEPFRDEWAVARAAVGVYRRLSDTHSLGAEIVVSKGWDLDRFSRLPFGRAPEVVAGFGSGRGFDQGIFAGVTWSTSIARKLPLTLLLEAGTQEIDGETPIDRVGASLRFRIHGPKKIDIWPIVGYGIASSVDGEAGDTSFGLVLSRRY